MNVEKCTNTAQNKSLISEIELNALNPDFFLKNGVLYYKNVPYSGIYLVNYKNDNIKRKEKYLNGKQHGYSNTWYPDGKKFTERFYSKGHKVKVHIGWWNNGVKKFEYHFNDIGQYQGSVKEWYETGLIFRDFNYTNGRENGSQKAWKSDGRIKANYEVVNGERYGLIGLKKCITVTNKQDK